MPDWQKIAKTCQTEEIPRPYRCKESSKLQSSKGRQGKAMIRTVVCLSKKCKIHGEDAKSGSHSHHCLSLGDADAVTVAQIGSDWQSGRWLQLICSSTRTFAFGSSPGWLHGTALAKSAPGRGGRCRRCRRAQRAQPWHTVHWRNAPSCQGHRPSKRRPWDLDKL